MSAIRAAESEQSKRAQFRFWRMTWNREWTTAYLFSFPVIAVLLGLVASPLISSLWMSLTDLKVAGEGRFIGLGNYIRLFKMTNPPYLQVLWQTLFYTVVGVGAKLVIGLITAVLINQNLPGKNVFRALLFVPWAVPMLIGALAWRWMFSDVNGVLSIGLMRLGIVNQYIYWFTDGNLAMFAVMLVMIWGGAPFFTMNFLAGMQAIPDELYEAAAIDGATGWQKLVNITLPGIRDVMTVTLLLSSIWTSSTLQYVYVLTNGGPAYRTEIFPTLSLHITLGARDLGLGAAAALASVPFLLVLIFLLTPRMLKEQI